MNVKQKRFAEEYVVDYNGTAAAIRAGYSENSAKVQASQLLAKPEIAALVQKLDANTAEALGLDAQDVLERIITDWDAARTLQPRIWKGEPVTYRDPDTGEVREVMEFRSPAVMTKSMELLLKRAGFEQSRQPADQDGTITVTLGLPPLGEQEEE